MQMLNYQAPEGEEEVTISYFSGDHNANNEEEVIEDDKQL